MPILEVEQLNKVFPSSGGGMFSALTDVSFSVEEGECVGLIGESGSGKSTIVNLIAGFLPPTSGTIRYDGRNRRAGPCRWSFRTL